MIKSGQPGKSMPPGFTLVEMMTVIAFLGILMAIAIPTYLNFQKKAKEAEARANLGAIRSCFISYFAEANNFNVGSVGTVVFNNTDNQGTPFGASSSAIGDNKRWDGSTAFSVVGFNAEGGVFFNYSLTTNNLSGESASFTVQASADLDQNTLLSHYSMNQDATGIEHDGDRF